ncbi:MAG: hypothetical protein Q9220_003702 [cf. Caloplaca sp. 1 TL-2023]
MLPLGLLNAAQGHPMLVELKNGETLNGRLVNCDTWMNLTLKEVVQTNPEGTAFFRLPEIKYLRVPDEIIDHVKDQQQNQPSSRGRGGGVQRGGGDRGRGGARGGGGRGRGRDPSWHGKRDNNLQKKKDFFSGDQTVAYDASKQLTGPADESKIARNGSDRDQWGWGWKSPSSSASLRTTNFWRSNKNLEKKEPQALSGEDLRFKPDRGFPGSQEIQTAKFDSSRQRHSAFRSRNGREIRDLGKEELDEDLRRASHAGDFPRVREILRILIGEHGQKPDRRHYIALLLSNTNPQHGLPLHIMQVLEEMESEGIAMDSAIYHAIIRVLAVHPDYLLRRQILDELRQRWFALSNDGWHDLLAGLLRDKQLELAIETLRDIRQEGIRIQPWLYDSVIFMLCEAEEFDEALSILQFRVDNGDQLISGTIWYHFLDSASRAFHHTATVYAWRKRVGKECLNPSLGICLNVLNTAARHNNILLATDAIRVLANRNQTPQLYHYEALIESYLPSNLRGAFIILVFLTSSGISVTESSTRAIFVELCKDHRLPKTALSILHDLREQQRPIPVEAVNVILESYIYHGNFDAALETYKSLHTICPSGPLTGTYNVMLRGCRSRKETAMFLASEMVAMKVLPNALTYDRLILICLQEVSDRNNVGDAWRYFEEMQEAGWWPRPGTAVALARKLSALNDERIWRLQGDGLGESGISISVLRKMVNENRVSTTHETGSQEQGKMMSTAKHESAQG